MITQEQRDHASHGFKLIDDTNVHTAGEGAHASVGYFYNLVVASDAVFDTGTVATGGDKPSVSITYPAGFPIRGIFSAVQLQSGVVHAHIIPA